MDYGALCDCNAQEDLEQPRFAPLADVTEILNRLDRAARAPVC